MHFTQVIDGMIRGYKVYYQTTAEPSKIKINSEALKLWEQEVRENMPLFPNANPKVAPSFRGIPIEIDEDCRLPELE